MKSFKFLFISLFLTINIFAQKSDWGSWTQTPCFKGISFRVRIAENTLYSDNRYKYEVEFKNNYSTTVSFSYLLTDFNSSNTLCKERIKLLSGSTKIAWSLLSTTNNTTIRVYTEKACFEENGNCGQYNKQCYANCDNGIPNIPTDCNKSNNQNASTSSTSSISINNGGGYIGNDKSSSNRIDTEKNQSYQQFKQNGERLLKEQKFSEAKEEFQKSLQYSVNDSQIAYSNKMIAFCDEYSKKNEKYDNISKGLQTTSNILDKVFEKDKTNVFGNNQKDTSENLYMYNQELQKLITGINKEDDILTIGKNLQNYFNSISLNFQSEVINDKSLIKKIYYANSSIVIEIDGGKNQISLKFDKNYLNLGRKIYNAIESPFLKTTNNNKLFPYIIVYQVTPKNSSREIIFNNSVELINKINKNDVSIEEISEIIKNYFENLGYKSYKIDFSDKSLIQITYFDFHINIYTNNNKNIKVIEIVSKNNNTINEIIQKLKNENFTKSNSEDYYYLRYNFNKQSSVNTNNDITELLEKYNKIISDYSKDNNSINLESNLRTLINENPEILKIDKQFNITYSSVLTTNASKLYNEGEFLEAEQKIRESLKYDKDNLTTNQYLLNLLLFKYNDNAIKDVKEIVKELNSLINKLLLIDKENTNQYIDIKNKINK